MTNQKTQPTASVRRSWSRVAILDNAVPTDLADALWTRPNELVALAEPLQCKGVRSTRLLTWASQRYVLKHYLEPSWWHTFKRHIQSSRARATWTVTHRLADAGIATPRPVACVENRLGPLQRDSYLMYPYVEGRTLRSCLAEEAAKSTALEHLWDQLGQLWQRLAQLRASLADTNVGNFIVCPAGHLWVIDLDKSRFHRLAHSAARQQERGWKFLLRSAAKHAGTAQALRPHHPGETTSALLQAPRR